ncbi:MAG: response regulator [Cyclobacteriaceae bacterium]|nr:response regulator [Cyclobacteriaceae bacterium HetDA_MAG_MS6]
MITHPILIVEDEPLIGQDLKFLLEDMGLTEVSLVLKYDTALEWLKTRPFSLVLLDINLSGEKDGIHLAEFINDHFSIPFIFITSYYNRETISRAKKTNPAAYILKPFDQHDIKVNVEIVLYQLDQVKNQQPVFVRDKTGMTTIDPSSVCYVEADDNYSRLVSQESQQVVSHTLKKMEDELKDYGFIRVHKSFLINLKKVNMVKEGYVYLDEFKIPIGRTYRQEFMDHISIL